MPPSSPIERPGAPGTAPERPRRILHVDVDAFLASVESARCPELAGRPLVIGGSPKSRNLVMSCSYEARAFGVRPGMHLAEAARRCPKAIFRDGDARAANALREDLTRLLIGFTPVVAVTSIDDFLVDATGTERLHGAARDLATAIAREARARLRVPLSIGVGANPLLARLAGKLAKPGKVAELLPGREDAWLRGLPVDALPGVGHRIGRELARFSIRTVGDLRLVSRELLYASFGRPGLELFARSRGQDPTRVEATHRLGEDGCLVADPPRSLRRETTFEPEEGDFELVEAMLAWLCERGTARLRAVGARVRSVEVSLRYVDTRPPTSIARRGAAPPDERVPLGTLRRRRRLVEPGDSTQLVIEHARALLRELPRRRALVKRVGVALLDLEPTTGRQRRLFEGGPGDLERDPLHARSQDPGHDPGHDLDHAVPRGDRHRLVDAALDRLRARWGFGGVVRGASLPVGRTHPLGPDGFVLRTPSLNQ